MAKIPQIYSRIEKLRERYYKALPGKESLVKLIYDAEVSEQVYNSNAIENSTLSLEETEKILQQIALDRYVNEREVFEARNLSRVVGYIETKALEAELSLPIILLLHQMLISNIRDDIAGRFRVSGEWVRVGSHIGADPKDIEPLITNMLTTYRASSHENIIKRIARAHLSFENTHPFVDGNGRIGRVINNFLLIRDGYVPINIAFVDRAMYYEAFREFDRTGSISIMSELVGRALTNSYHKRLAYLEERKIVTLNEYAKAHKLSHSGLINKAKRQTIDAFIERGVWKIGK